MLLATAGHAARQVAALLGPSLARGALRARCCRRSAQPDYDHLLWSCDLNFVRGEDSFVRAQWAGRPFVWQVYPQHDGAHAAKLEAFLDRFAAGRRDGARLRRLCRGLERRCRRAARLPAAPAGASTARRWRDRLLAQPDLVQPAARLRRRKTLKSEALRASREPGVACAYHTRKSP